MLVEPSDAIRNFQQTIVDKYFVKSEEHITPARMAEAKEVINKMLQSRLDRGLSQPLTDRSICVNPSRRIMPKPAINETSHVALAGRITG